MIERRNSFEYEDNEGKENLDAFIENYEKWLIFEVGKAIKKHIQCALLEIDENFSSPEMPAGLITANNVAISSLPTSTSHLYNTYQRVANLFLNPHLSDVTFRLRYDKNDENHFIDYPAHRFILAMSSPVFYAMFYGQLKTDNHIINIVDVDASAFKNLLRYVYTDNVHQSPDNVISTLYAAKKYNIEHLERLCVEYLKCILEPNNAFLMLGQAYIFDEKQLANACLNVIDRFSSEALQSDSFLDIDKAILEIIVKRDSLAVRESDLFEAITRWAINKCNELQLQPTAENQKKLLGRNIIYSIRYPLMHLHEFSPLVPQSGLLESEDLVKLYLYFTVTNTVVSPLPFISMPRRSFLGKELVVNRFRRVETRWGYSGTSDRVRFFVDKRIYVVALGLYGSIHGPHEYNVNILMMDYDSNKVVAVNSVKLKCDGTQNPFRVAFKSPIEILPNVNYAACATLLGPDSFYGTRGLRKVTVEMPDRSEEEWITFHFTFAGGNNNGTSVEDGQIPQIIFHIPATTTTDST
ncbi:hypothetical protein GJ496_005215 [Pomphorhynchus laevis]|nr:hypothetical protein GJ496_005215 [Pomphorhynchus laevis]